MLRVVAAINRSAGSPCRFSDAESVAIDGVMGSTPSPRAESTSSMKLCVSVAGSRRPLLMSIAISQSEMSQQLKSPDRAESSVARALSVRRFGVSASKIRTQVSRTNIGIPVYIDRRNDVADGCTRAKLTKPLARVLHLIAEGRQSSHNSPSHRDSYLVTSFYRLDIFREILAQLCHIDMFHDAPYVHLKCTMRLRENQRSPEAGGERLCWSYKRSP